MTMYFLDSKDGKDTNSGLSWDEAFLTHERLDKELAKSLKKRLELMDLMTNYFNDKYGETK